jgi:alkaline phosphatase
MKIRSCHIKFAFFAVAIGFIFTFVSCAIHQKSSANTKSPLYVFFFIGDGMASAQIHATEAYLAATAEDEAKAEGIKVSRLTMSGLPVLGMQTSNANNRFITGSAAAGTALACGEKTNIGVIAMRPDTTTPSTSLAEAAKAKGMKVGIVTSVSLDHATPAVFYAHTESRKNYEKIGEFLLKSNFDYFAGGGFRVDKYKSDAYAGLTNEERYTVVASRAKANGFTYTDTRTEFDALSEKQGHVIAIHPTLDVYDAIPYALNRRTGDTAGKTDENFITLAEFTQKGIDLMEKSDNGFFMMVEGGKIDWACHANDARTAIEEIIAFDEAVGVAVDFAKEHPERTLIVVTGDHECGGLALGFAGMGYETDFEKLSAQTIAYDDFFSQPLSAYKKRNTPAPDDINADMWQIIFENYKMDGHRITATKEDDLTEYEIELLEDAFDKSITGTNKNAEEKNALLYGRNDPLTVTLTHLLNRKSGLSWTSFSHTAMPVPVFAMGYRSELFDGYYDNTEVARKMAEVMNVSVGRIGKP